MTVIVLLLLILISLWVGFYQLVKQYGRLLLRLDQLEHRAPDGARGTPDEEVEPAGLSMGTPFPSFEFPDLDGKMVALGGFRGTQLLLVHWNFECGFCESIAGDLARLDTAFQKRNIQLMLLAYGDVKSNREQTSEHRLKCPILLMKDQETPEPFAQYGTPGAYLLDEEARVASPFASGADRVLSLAHYVASREAGAFEALERQGILAQKGRLGLGDIIKRLTFAIGIKPCAGCERRAALLNRWIGFSRRQSGIKAGKRAPVFRLPDLGGRMVSLEEYLGRHVVLVFSDPQCGPCDELAPHLARLHRKHANNGLAVIVVARGNAEDNRRKAKQHGFEFPVLLQDRKWKVSKEYGILATPAAFLIREDGAIAADAAVGTDAILALARDGARRSREG
jgi:peroxiredoxin